ncbi:MAG: leucine-rich repeat domain-containing protein, partial [Muribaculaceae bacterium]|nr:leucine-rich repeat domain-containing protein [Muribaculaceae bacterium]
YITNIGYGVFEYCSSLWQIKYNAVDADVAPLFSQHPGRPCSFKNITIGDGVKRIPTGIFDSNHGPTEIVLPKSVERIDTAAFYFCKNLRSIYIPDNITVIEPQTFAECHNLEEVRMPLNIERISNYAFYLCESLKTISIPEGTKILEEYAFYGNYNASTLYLPSTLISIGGAAFYQLGRNTEVKITSASVDPLIADDYYKDILYGVDVRDVVQIKVPNASVEDYKNHPQWGRFADVIIPIDEIAVSEESASTSFSDMVDQDADLSDTVVGNVYVTMSEDDGYDESDGSLVLCSTMGDDDADAIGGMSPGKSDLANRFNGLVVLVPAGHGTVIIDCLTIGSREVCVKIGDAEPQSFTKSAKGEIVVDYDVVNDTYVYIYAADSNSAARIVSRAVSDINNCVKIYSVGVNPVPAGINDVFDDSNSGITDYFTVEGIRLDSPTAPGVYIVRRADGSTSKILIK